MHRTALRECEERRIGSKAVKRPVTALPHSWKADALASIVRHAASTFLMFRCDRKVLWLLKESVLIKKGLGRMTQKQVDTHFQ